MPLSYIVIRLRENLRALFYAPYYVAHELDLFTTAGVEVALEPSNNPLDTAAQLLAGEVDIVWGGPLRVLRILDEDPSADLVCFGEVVGRDPFLVVARDDRPIEDLRLGVVSEVVTPWICLQQDLRDQGVDIDSMDVESGSTMEENLAAFTRGDLDGFQAFQPYVEAAVTNVPDARLHAAAQRGPTAYTCFYSTHAMLAARQAEFEAMAGAMRDAVAWVLARPGVESAKVIRQWFPNLDVELAGMAIDRYRDLGIYNTSGELSREGFDRLALSMRNAGFIQSAARYEDCVIAL